MTALAKHNVIRTFVPTLGASEALTLVSQWLGGLLARVTSSDSGTGGVPCAGAIAAYTPILVSSSRPNIDLPGVLFAPTFEIRGSPSLAMAIGLAFGAPGHTIIPGNSFVPTTGFRCLTLSVPAARHAAPTERQRAWPR
jgi:hypothetical protein